jgi:hypothetical protein
MTVPTSKDADARVAGAYSWAAGLVGLARRLVTDGVDVDLEPIRPAVRELCQEIKELPSAEASQWITRLIDLQHEMAALARALADRDRLGSDDGEAGHERR